MSMKTELEEILVSLGVKKSQIIPKILSDDVEFNLFCNDDNSFPLDWFDNGSELITADYGNGFAFIPDSSSYAEHYDWLEVNILNWIETSSKWQIKELKSGMIYEIPKIYLMLANEKPNVHALRIQQAVQLRNECQKSLKLEASLNSMDLSNFPKPERRVQKKIRKLMCNQFNIRWIELFEHEHCILYQKTLAKMKIAALVAEESQNFPLFKYPKTKRDIKNKAPIVEEKCEKQNENYKNSRIKFQRNWLYSCPEVLKILKFIQMDCERISHMFLFEIPINNDWSWMDFVNANNAKLDDVAKFFKENWTEDVVNEINRQLINHRKGWLDLNVDDWFIYKSSKLFSLIELIKQRMKTAIESMLRSSLQAFSSRLCQPCESMFNIAEDFVWGDDLINSQFPSLQPIFSIELDIIDDQPAYTTNIEEFQKQLVEMMKTPILVTHKIPLINPFLLSNLKFEKNLKLSSIGLLDDEIQTQIGNVSQNYLACQIPLRSYAKMFFKFADFKNLDIEDYVWSWKESEKTAKEMKTEFLYQLTSLDEIELTIPTTIVIGPVKVLVTMKKDLILKRRELFDKLMEMFKEKVKQKLEVINYEFKEIVTKLTKKSESIEELIAIQHWLPQIPKEVEQIQINLKQMSADFEVLESFLVTLSDDVMQMKLLSHLMPLDIRKKIVETQSRHEVEFELFRRLQAAHETQFLGQVEAIGPKVQACLMLQDYQDVLKVSYQIEEQWKVLNETLDRSAMLNNRQLIFEQPPIDLDALNNFIQRLRPHYNFWSMASSFHRSTDGWTSIPLLSVDINVFTTEVKQCEKILQESREYFTFNDKMMVLIENFAKDFDEFSNSLEILRDLKNPDFQIEHGAMLSEKTGIQFEYSPEMTFDSLVVRGFIKNAAIVKQISVEATRKREENDIQNIKDEQKRLQEIEHLKEIKARRAARMHIFN